MNCAICLSYKIPSQDICITQCNHKFCKSCIYSWFDTGINTCPLCRSPLQYITINGIQTRIISIKQTNQIIQPPIIPLSSNSVSMYRNNYLAMLITLGTLIMSNGFTFYYMFYNC